MLHSCRRAGIIIPRHPSFVGVRQLYDKGHRMAMHEFKESQGYFALNNGILTHQRGIERDMAGNMNQAYESSSSDLAENH